MKRIHHNQLWLTASEAAEFANRDRKTIRNWAMAGLVKARPNPTKPNRHAIQYYLPDIKERIGII